MPDGFVLIVDDDAETSRLLAILLGADGLETAVAANSADALLAVAAREPDLVLLDVSLGAEDGRDLFRELRCVSDIPVVFLTGRGHEIDRIAGLKMGADDYIVKPFSPGELAARVEAVLRRSGGPKPAAHRQSGLVFGELEIHRTSREVRVFGELVELTAKEFDLLLFLAESPRQVFTRAQLLDHVWKSSADWQDDATVTEHVRRLRRKVEVDPEHPSWIRTVRGVGYRFEPGAGGRRPAVP